MLSWSAVRVAGTSGMTIRVPISMDTARGRKRDRVSPPMDPAPGPASRARPSVGVSWGQLGVGWGRLGVGWGRLGVGWGRLGVGWGRLGLAMDAARGRKRDRAAPPTSVTLVIVT